MSLHTSSYVDQSQCHILVMGYVCVYSSMVKWVKLHVRLHICWSISLTCVDEKSIKQAHKCRMLFNLEVEGLRDRFTSKGRQCKERTTSVLFVLSKRNPCHPETAYALWLLLLGTAKLGCPEKYWILDLT